MVKFTALYKKPENIKDFDDHYAKIHTPLVTKLPGLKRLEIAKVTGAPRGESPYHLIAELYFENMDALNAAFSGPEGKAAAKDVSSFAGDLVQMMVSEIEVSIHNTCETHN